MAERITEGRHSDVVSLADEEKVKEILVSTVLDLWEVVNNLTRLRPSKKRALPGIHLRLRADSERFVGLQRGHTPCQGTFRYGLRYRDRGRSGPDAGGQ